MFANLVDVFYKKNMNEQKGCNLTILKSWN